MLEDRAVPAYRPTATHVNLEAVEQAAALLRAAKRPLIIAGAGLDRGDGRAVLRKFAEETSIPVVVSFRRHDLFPNDHPLYGGDLGVTNTPEQMAAFDDCDVILAIGTRLGDLTTHGYTFPKIPWPTQKLIHVYDDADVIGASFEPTVGAACDPAAFLEALAVADAGTPNAVRQDHAKKLSGIQASIGKWTPRQAEDGVVFGNVIAALSDRLDDDGIVVPDAGISAALVYRHFVFRPPQRLFATVTGVMGFGVPGAIAVAMRNPGRHVVSLLGDGGFLMTGNELAIAVDRKLPILFILSNNRSLGTIRAYQERMYPGRPVATDLTTPDFEILGRAFGCKTIVVTSEDQVGPALEAGFAHRGGPVLVEIRTSISAILPSRV